MRRRAAKASGRELAASDPNMRSQIWHSLPAERRWAETRSALSPAPLERQSPDVPDSRANKDQSARTFRERPHVVWPKTFFLRVNL